ncbi:hypothetical protein [Clostridium sp. BJN0013]|uniref:hypothetical protein n=1 Tax=Clostridium sp. BJN0013 TaxID=3236840 RepID=UPI0034C5BD0C
MWIRSQDKKAMVKIQATNINYNQPGQILGWIPPFDTLDSCFILGDYGTDKRAIEVLDEIQNEISNCVEFTHTTKFLSKSEGNVSNTSTSYIVYQMPEK